jgi:hypothetical protein
MQQMQRPAPEWKKFFYISIVVSICSLIIAVISFTAHKVDSTRSGARINALQKIQKQGVLRCGYAGFPPYIIINPNETDASKRLSGFAVDLVDEIAKHSVPPLKVEWHTMNWDTAKADLGSGKFDVIADPESIISVVSAITDLRETDDSGELAIILVTHLMHFAAEFADLIAFMHEGTIHEMLPAKEFFAQCQREETRKFVSTFSHQGTADGG